MYNVVIVWSFGGRGILLSLYSYFISPKITDGLIFDESLGTISGMYVGEEKTVEYTVTAVYNSHYNISDTFSFIFKSNSRITSLSSRSFLFSSEWLFNVLLSFRRMGKFLQWTLFPTNSCRFLCFS